MPPKGKTAPKATPPVDDTPSGIPEDTNPQAEEGAPAQAGDPADNPTDGAVADAEPAEATAGAITTKIVIDGGALNAALVQSVKDTRAKSSAKPAGDDDLMSGDPTATERGLAHVPCQVCFPDGWPVEEEGAYVNCAHDFGIRYGEPVEITRERAVELGFLDGRPVTD